MVALSPTSCSGRFRAGRRGHRRYARRPADLGGRRPGWGPRSRAAATTPSPGRCSSSPIERWSRRTRRSRSLRRHRGSATALAAAGGKNLGFLGADGASQCLQRGLVDEILVYVLPVLLGDVIRFSSPGGARTDLEPLSSTRSGDATILRFRVRGSPVRPPASSRSPVPGWQQVSDGMRRSSAWWPSRPWWAFGGCGHHLIKASSGAGTERA